MEEAGSGKILKEAEAFWQNKLEAEVTNSLRKRKQKIPRVKKWKQTRKHETSREAGNGSKKYSTASTSLVQLLLVVYKTRVSGQVSGDKGP